MADSNNAPLSRADVVSEVSAQVDLPASQVETVIRAFEGSLIRAVSSGTEVRLLGLGTFKQNSRAARSGRNPATGAAIKIAASKGVSFKAGKAFKDSVNSGGKKAKGAKATPAAKGSSASASASKSGTAKSASSGAGSAGGKATAKAAPAKAAAPKATASKAAASKAAPAKSGGAKAATPNISKSVAGKVLATGSKGGGSKGGKKK